LFFHFGVVLVRILISPKKYLIPFRVERPFYSDTPRNVNTFFLTIFKQAAGMADLSRERWKFAADTAASTGMRRWKRMTQAETTPNIRL
jgi:hypothetical protein